ncbi:MAG: glutamate--tRNA ligase [Chitinophagales bacterium]|nr:glutamate--tRNA ligase [Chitinophagales bacterium]
MKESQKVRTRFAPSPTGPLHIGGLRTALYAYLYAKRHQGDFLLRIEDTDQNRLVEGSYEIIVESLKWCGINLDESPENPGKFGPYIQSQRKEIYQKEIQKLLENGSAYYAFDSEEEIQAFRERTKSENNGFSLPYNFQTRNTMKNSLTMSDREVAEAIKTLPYVIRLKIDAHNDVSFYDEIRGEMHFDAAQLDDRVLMKSDGMPTYHFANVVDDHLMEITHVIRGEEWLNSTAHHILLYKAFGWEPPVFAHLPLILKPEGQGKLSKRDAEAAGFPIYCVAWQNPSTLEISDGYREKGFLPEAFINFMALLGWNDGTETEIMNLETLIKRFSLDRVHKSGAKFNYEKALWFNQQYILNLPDEKLLEELEGHLDKNRCIITSENLIHYVRTYKPRIQFISEISSIGDYLLYPIEKMDLETFGKKWSPDFLSYIQEFTALIQNTAFELLEEANKALINSHQLKMGQIMPILRLLLSGTTQGPSIYEQIQILGAKNAIQRLNEIPKI